MNEITHESSTYSPITIPPFDGLAGFKIEYKHKLKKPFPNLLKIELTIVLHLEEEFTGQNKFKIMQAICKHRIKVNDKLTAKELAQIWHSGALYLIDIFNKFEMIKFKQKHEINHSSVDELIPIVAPLVNWFYNNQQN